MTGCDCAIWNGEGEVEVRQDRIRKSSCFGVTALEPASAFFPPDLAFVMHSPVYELQSADDPRKSLGLRRHGAPDFIEHIGEVGEEFAGGWG